MRHLDETDARLILALTADPRGTVVALADRLGLSRNTVQARLTRLDETDALLGFERRVNPVSLGYPLAAFIFITVQQQRLRAIVDELAEIPEIIQAHGMSGRADLMVLVACVDADDLFRVNGEVLACEGVEHTETSLAMGELIPFRMTPLLERGPRSAS